MTSWGRRIRAIHDGAFATDWVSHLSALNAELGLTGTATLATPAPGLPPMWFVGDIESIQPGNWLLVVSLNPAHRPDDEDWHIAQRYSQQSYWDHWRLMYTRYPETRFNGAFAQIAAGICDAEITDAAAFAASRIVFAEICPYASASFGLDATTLDDLRRQDLGFQLAAEVCDLLIAEAQPGAVLVNGMAAIDQVEKRYSGRLAWDRMEYVSTTRPGKRLWHVQGELEGQPPSLIAGFPFLRKPATHNAYAEIRQIGQHLRTLGLKNGTLPDLLAG